MREEGNGCLDQLAGSIALNLSPIPSSNVDLGGKGGTSLIMNEVAENNGKGSGRTPGDQGWYWTCSSQWDLRKIPLTLLTLNFFLCSMRM